MKKELFTLTICLAQFAIAFSQIKTHSTTLPVAICNPNPQAAIGAGQAQIAAADLDLGSFDPFGQPVFFKIRKAANLGGPFADSLQFGCDEVGSAVGVVLRVYDLWPGAGEVTDTAFSGHFSDCQTVVSVVDLQKPLCIAPPSLTIDCQSLDGPLPWPGGLAVSDNCGIKGIDTSFVYLPSQLDFFEKKYGRAVRVFKVTDLAGNSRTATQSLTVNYQERFRIHFPDDRTTAVCDSTTFTDTAAVLAEHCELMEVSHIDQIFLVVPDLCVKIIRAHRVINLATYNPNLPEVNLTNPANSDVGPTIWVGADGANLPAWAPADPISPNTPTVAERTVNYPAPLAWQTGTPAYTYLQIIKILDETPPTAVLPAYDFCDSSTNSPLLWNQDATYNPWGITGTWDPFLLTHDLQECTVDLNLPASDGCSGTDVNFRFLLFLDLDGNGTMETTINGENPAWGFGLREDEVANGKRIARIVRDEESDDGAPFFNHQKVANFTLPYGSHKIKWTVEDYCGNNYTVE